jgi:hypothetical protein
VVLEASVYDIISLAGVVLKPADADGNAETDHRIDRVAKPVPELETAYRARKKRVKPTKALQKPGHLTPTDQRHRGHESAAAPRSG